MAKEGVVLFVGLAVFFLSLREAFALKQSYVVYLGGHREENLQHEKIHDDHCELLGSILGSKTAARESIFYSYSRHINWFAAFLEEDQAQALSKLPGVLSVFVNKLRQLHITHSWGWLGLEKGNPDQFIVPKDSLWRKANFGKDVIIANLDTGVWPEGPSFHDTGLGPVPDRWRGGCQSGTNFSAANCNRKLIGARYFKIGSKPDNVSERFFSPRDSIGHGSHTLSTAGGNFAPNASLYGIAEGIAKGGAPHARLVAYKICWSYGCSEADILAAFDTGIYEGVDVFSLSVGGSVPVDYFEDAISIGAFHAVQRGKVVVCSAGNDGPEPATVTNVAPWIITVGASTLDRKLVSFAYLGNMKVYEGTSISEFTLPKGKMYPLVSSVDVKASGANETAGKLCFPGALDPMKVKGKIVACLRGINTRMEKGITVQEAGGVGMILCNTPEINDLFPDPHVLPATQLNAINGEKVFEYINSTNSPVAYIGPPTAILNAKPAPVVSNFSSRGPNSLTLDILKPDITAPGDNILAAWSHVANISSLSGAGYPFNIISGTSMSCPHVSGVVALLKAAYPHWSPAAIRSAIMTTAITRDNTKQPIKDSLNQIAGPLDYGAGHINPNGAANPGLLYDLSNIDYYKFLCSLNYNSSQIKMLTGKSFFCSNRKDAIHNLNYPSITVSELKGPLFVWRTMTYVSEGPAMFEAKVKSPPGVVVAVKPNKLEFSQMGEKKTFSVIMKPKKGVKNDYVFGSLTWAHGDHVVRSPIVVNVVTA